MNFRTRAIVRAMAVMGLTGRGDVVTATVAAGSAVALTDNTSANVTSVALTPGTWDLRGQVDYTLSGVTGTVYKSGFSLTSAALPVQTGGAGLGTDPLAQAPLISTLLTSVFSHTLKSTVLTIAANTTVYLVANQAFTVGSSSAHGTITAVRLK